MARYQFVIEGKRRKISNKIIEADSIEEATREAKRSGKVISCKKKMSMITIKTPLTPADRQIFLQRLAAMQASKVGAGEALSLMQATFEGPIKRISGEMLRHVENGDDIGEAMERMSSADFPSNVVALVKSGSKGGDTSKALINAAEFEAEMERIKRSSGQGIGSGIAGFISAAGVTFGTTGYFGPMVMESDLIKIGAENIDVGWAQTLADWLTIIMTIMTVTMVLLYLLSSFGRFVLPRQSDAIIMRIPFYKDLILARNNYTILYGLSILAGSGVPMEAALKLAYESSPKGVMQEDLRKAHKQVKVGKPWATAMSSLHPTDKAALMSSQDRDQIAKSLYNVSVQYRAIYAQRVAVLAPILQGVAMIFLIASGAVLFGLTVMPILQMSAGGL